MAIAKPSSALDVYETVPYIWLAMPRGQPRENAILIAAQAALRANGYDAMTIDDVAARAHSSKATIYRRWKNKAELVTALLDRMDAEDTASIPRTGALRSDLLALMNTIRRKAKSPELELIQDLVQAAKREPALAAALQKHLANERVSPMHEVLGRHFRRGEADFDLIHDVAEAMIQRQLQLGLRIDATFSKRVVDRIVLPLLAVKRVSRQR